MSETKSEIIPVRVTPSEAALFKLEAAKEYRPMSQWARLQVLRSLGAIPATATKGAGHDPANA